MRRFASVIAAISATGAVAFAILTAAPAGAASTASMPTINLGMNGSSITVGGTLESGAVNVVSTVSDVNVAEPTLLYLRPGVTYKQALAGVIAHGGDLRYLAPYGAIVFNLRAKKGTSTAQTVLPAGHYVALDTEAAPPSRLTDFTVANNPTPASLPGARSTVTMIDFAYRGAKTLHNGSVVRFQNTGFLVHMVVGLRAKNHKAAKKIAKMLQEGRIGPAVRHTDGVQRFAGILSGGGVDQYTLHARKGYWVIASLEETQYHRFDTQLGMVRIIRIR